LALGASGTLLTSAVKPSGAASDSGTDAGFGAPGRFGVAVDFGAAVRFGAPVDLGVAGRFDAAPGDVAELGLWDAARGCDAFDALGRDSVDFDGLCFDDLCLDAAGTLAPTFVSAAALREEAALRARACTAACAASAFFFACLAAFLLAFANFRARLRTLLAARTCCFAASARATAVVASAFSRCAATAPFVRGSVD
jgi:hypothetical protein